MLSTLPVAFVPPRGAPQYYITFFGWVLYVATALTMALARLIRPARWRPAVVFALMLLLFPLYRAKGWRNVYSVRVEGLMLEDVATQLHQLHPRFPPHSRLLFLNDPVQPDLENLVFVVRLSYADDTLTVDRAKRMPHRPPDNELAAYDHVFDYRAGHFLELFRPWQWKGRPILCLSPRGPELFHSDWARVTAKQPARRGEMLIARVAGLGTTSPAVPPDQPFAAEPRARVTDIDIKVNNRNAEPGEVFGWPGEIDIFRMDFRVPQVTAAGTATLEIAANGATGLPAQFPVR
jgi:hypothetical protein